MIKEPGHYVFALSKTLEGMKFLRQNPVAHATYMDATRHKDSIDFGRQPYIITIAPTKPDTGQLPIEGYTTKSPAGQLADLIGENRTLKDRVDYLKAAAEMLVPKAKRITQLRRFYVTMTWDDFPEGGSYGNIFEAVDVGAAVLRCREAMAESRIEERDGEGNVSELVKQYANIWHVIDCWDVDAFVERNLPPADAGEPMPVESLTHCATCNVLLDQPDKPLTRDCGGDCWGCVGKEEYGGMTDAERMNFNILRFPEGDWQYEVANGGTIRGLIEWRLSKAEAEQED